MPAPTKQRQRRSTANSLCYEGGKVHTWEARGLDVVSDTLCNVRRCLRCPAEQHKPYGGGTWQDTK